MDFKKKIKKIVSDIREHTGKTPEDEIAPIDFTVSPAVAKFKEHLSQTVDPIKDRELIDKIDSEYFQDENFDACEHELKKLPEELSLQEINEDRNNLRKELSAVSKKVSELVMQKHPQFAAELKRVMELQENLHGASIICAHGREQLAKAKYGFTTASLGLLANYKKRQQLVSLLTTLRTIRTLQRTDIRLREMLEEEDYAGAIQLCLECQKAASTFRHYTCISELSSKLQDTLEMIEESLDVALSKTCSGFDEPHYEKVQTAYRLLGKTQTAMDQLHMHFTSAIHNTAFTIVLGYVELCAGSGGDGTFQKKQYSDLCKNISVDVFTACLTALCKALWLVMKSYRKTIEWHEANDTDMAPEQEGQNSTMEANVNRRYIKQKLEHGLGRIWGDVQHKVKVYLLSTDLSYFKYDDFIHVLDIVNRLIQVGEEFCGSKSEGLHDSIRKQSINYFRNYHRARMDELRMFLENEGWELCPVKSNFSIFHLQEFKFLRALADLKPDETLSISRLEEANVNKSDWGYFEKYADAGSPFDAQNEEETEEDVLETNGYDPGTPGAFSNDSDSDEDVPEELKLDFVDEKTGETPSQKRNMQAKRKSLGGKGRKAAIITNTTLNVCRLFGKYMQMMSVLKPIAFDVTICLSQLFDYYLFTVYSFFGTEPYSIENNDRILSSRLQTTLKRIRENLILVEEDEMGGGATPNHDKVAHPHISPVVELNNQDQLHGLSEKVVATESLIFLASQFEYLQPHLEATIPASKKAFLQQFYSQTVSTAVELRIPVYRTVAVRALHYDHVLTLMSNVKWDIKDIMSQHSSYVDVMLHEFELFSERIAEVGRRVPIPKVASDVLWEFAIRYADRVFVEGYASAKKCSNEGRALMQLDFQQFLIKLEKITDLRPIPDREFVESYVKAYYLPEAQLEMWIRDRKEYTPKQLTALVSCMAHINKKGRQRIIGMVEDMDRSRRQ